MSSLKETHRWKDVQPNQFRHLRACMVCAIVQTGTQFTQTGCPNCHPRIDYKASPDTVQECTSPVFEGLVSISDPTQSWIAKWLRLDGYVRGVYATKVVGELPEEALESLAEADIQYIPRDGSENNLE